MPLLVLLSAIFIALYLWLKGHKRGRKWDVYFVICPPLAIAQLAVLQFSSKRETC